MDMKAVLYHFFKLKEQKENQASEYFARLKLLLYIIHGQPEQMLENLNDIMGSEEKWDDEIGNIQKQQGRRYAGRG